MNENLEESIRAAIEAARDCGQGDLFLTEDGTVEFLMGYRNSLIHQIVIPDFWYVVQNFRDKKEIIRTVQEKIEEIVLC